MAFLRSLRIRAKLLSAFGLMFALLLAVGGFGAIQMRSVNSASADVRDKWLPSTRVLGQLDAATTRYRQIEAAVLLVSTAEERAREQQGLSRAQEEVEKALERYEAMISAGEERRLADAARQAWRDYLTTHNRMMVLFRTDEPAAVRLYTGEARAVFLRLREHLADDLRLNTGAGAAAADAGEATYLRALWVMLGVITLAAMLAIVTVLWLNGELVARMVRLSGTMRQLARRDYDFDLACATRSDEIGDMARAIEDCRQGLREADALAATQAAETEAKIARTERVNTLVSGFEAEAADVLRMVLSALAPGMLSHAG